VVEVSRVGPQFFDAFNGISHEQFKLVVDASDPNNAAAPGSNTREFMINFLVEGTGIFVR